jgi:hypothetical protein
LPSYVYLLTSSYLSRVKQAFVAIFLAIVEGMTLPNVLKNDDF